MAFNGYVQLELENHINLKIVGHAITEFLMGDDTNFHYKAVGSSNLELYSKIYILYDAYIYGVIRF